MVIECDLLHTRWMAGYRVHQKAVCCCIVAGKARLLGKTIHLACRIDGQFKFLLTDPATMMLPVKIIGEPARAFIVARYAFDGADPDILLFVFGNMLDHIVADTAGIILFSIIENMESAAIIHIQTIPGGDPEQVVAIFEHIIDSAVGEAAAIVEVLKEELTG